MPRYWVVWVGRAGIASCLLVDLCITDYSTGALNNYPTNLTIVLTPGQEKTR